MTAPYDAGDAPTGAAYRPDPTTAPAERGRLAYRDVQIPGATPQIASAVPAVSDAPPVAVSGRSVAHSGRNEGTVDHPKAAAHSAILTAYETAWGQMPDTAGTAILCRLADAVVAAVTPLIAAQVRAQVAEEVIARAVADLRRTVNPSDATDLLIGMVERAMWTGFGCTCCGHADPTFVCLRDLTCPLHGSVPPDALAAVRSESGKDSSRA